ncbi:MAG: hypothetical protein QG636_173 [Patescibacteria group bacterium]|jgi:hypothetical protein|nr:hypothetical protein [Patescibacteria group bacterium]
MAFDRYTANVQRLADACGIVNPLREEDLLIAALVFKTLDGHETHIMATDFNRAGRLFFESACTFPTFRAHRIGYNSCFIKNAMEYFGELSKDVGKGKRPLIDAVAVSNFVTIVWKS